jgi:YHS domain-containing protein
MAHSEGIMVASDEQDNAQVVIQQGEPGPPCSSHPKGCLCTGGRPGLLLKAVNTANASVGDLVSISFKPGAMTKSLTMLLGIPAFGLLLGIVIGLALQQAFGFQPQVVYFSASTGLFVGIVSSIVTYRRISAEIRPFVSHIISAGSQTSALFKAVDPVCKREMGSMNTDAKLEYLGNTYYFCKSDCLKAFLKSPERYIPSPN